MRTVALLLVIVRSKYSFNAIEIELIEIDLTILQTIIRKLRSRVGLEEDADAEIYFHKDAVVGSACPELTRL
jgi:hypothetical protein